MGAKHNFVSFAARKSLQLFEQCKSNWKRYEKTFFKVIETEDLPDLMTHQDGRVKFPFYWAWKPDYKVEYDFGALSELECDIGFFYC